MLGSPSKGKAIKSPTIGRVGTGARVWVNPHTVVLFVIPIILLVANREWFFAAGSADPWAYYSAFFEYDQHYGQAHKIARLFWILKGYVFYHLLSPEAAYYTLHLVTLYTAVFAFYFLCALITDRRTAFLAALALTTYTNFHAVVGFDWNYHIHEAAADYLLGMLLATLATRIRRWRLALFAAGAVYGVAMQLPPSVWYLPAVGLWYLYFNWRGRRNPVVHSVAIFVTGAVVSMLSFCIFNYLTGGPFLFFMAEYYPIFATKFLQRSIAAHGGYMGWHPVLSLVRGFMAVPVVIFLGTLFVLARYAWRLARGRRLRGGGAAEPFGTLEFVSLNLLVVLLPHLVLNAMGLETLTSPAFVPYTYPAVFLALCAMLQALAPKYRILFGNKDGAVDAVLVLAFVGSLVAAVTAREFLSDASQALGFNVFAAMAGFKVHVMSGGGFFIPLSEPFSKEMAAHVGHVIIASATVTAIVCAAHGAYVVAWRWFAGVVGNPEFGLVGEIAAAAVIRRNVRLVAMMSLMLALNLTYSDMPAVYYDARYSCRFSQDQVLAVLDGYRAIRRADPQYTTRLWWDKDDRFDANRVARNGCAERRLPAISEFYQSLYMSRWGMRLLRGNSWRGRVAMGPQSVGRIAEGRPTGFSDISAKDVGSFSAKLTWGEGGESLSADRLAILGTTQSLHDRAIETLRRKNLRLRVLLEEWIERGLIKYKITVVQLSRS